MASKQDYLDLLAEDGLSEKDVSPIFRPELWSDKTAAAIISLRNRLRPNVFTQYDDLRRAVTSSSPIAILDFVLNGIRKQEAHKKFEELQSGNANMVISEIASNLERRLRVKLDVPVYHGVFPTRVFNAQALKRGSGYLVLLESSTLEMIEVAATLATLPPSLRSITVHGISDMCRSYYQSLGHKVSERYLPRPVEEYERELGRSAQSHYDVAIAMINAAEEFAVGHEWGHIVLGHALVGTSCAFERLEASGCPVEARASPRQDEFAADLWSMYKLMRSATLETFQMVVEGAFLFLCLGRQFEGYIDSDGLELETHPPATERLWMINRLADTYAKYRILFERPDPETSAARTLGQRDWTVTDSVKGVRSILNECYTSEFGRPPDNVAPSEPTLSALYTEIMSSIFPQDKNVWSTTGN